jgi:hypothetical protein
MSVKKKSDYYTKRPKVGKTMVNFNKYRNTDEILDKKLNIFSNDMNKGFCFYREITLLKFIEGHKEIPDFALQFIILEEYNSNNNKYANTLEKYIINYGYAIGTKKYNEKCNNIKGSKNPGYQHNGKYSSLSDNFIGDKAKKQEVIEKISKSNKENGNNDCTIIYWTNRGYSEFEAKEKISERQSTFSLKKNA